MSTISVVIPCYNAAVWIRETLSTVIAQTLPPLEIIVVDDGSTDGSGDIIAREFPQVRLIQVPNGGSSRARNIGWQAAQGEWIQFLDADDLLHPMKLAWQAAYLATQPLEVAFLFSPWRDLELQNGTWQAVGTVRSTTLASDLYAQALDNFTTLCSGLVRRAWLERVAGFDESKPLIEDVDLQLRIVRAGGTFVLVPTPEPIFSYRHLPKSLSTQSRARFVESCYVNACMTEAFLREDGQLTDERKQVLVRAYYFIARYDAAHNGARFNEVVNRIERLTPRFVPPGPRHLTFTSRMLGYRRAERVAVAYRRAKSWLRAGH